MAVTKSQGFAFEPAQFQQIIEDVLKIAKAAGATDAAAEVSEGSGLSVVTDGPAFQLEANAPGDIWRCTVIGCVHVVYGASGKLGRTPHTRSARAARRATSWMPRPMKSWSMER